jgi:N-acetylmuramoyl-L-alanine amidase
MRHAIQATMIRTLFALLAGSWSVLAGCAAGAERSSAIAIERRGTEIMACGRLYDIGAPVVLWTDPGGYDAYRVERRFVPWEQAAWEPTHAAGIAEPNRYGIRHAKRAAEKFTTEQFERVRGGGWDLDLLREHVDQFVLHYDVCGTSRTCFRVLHDMRGLSVHFMLDVDGTIYQTLDVKERAWHATISNDRSIGIEIASIGAYPPGDTASPLTEWYSREANGRTRITLPPRLGDGGVRTPGFVARSARDDAITGTINGSTVEMYDFTPEQYESLVKLTAALCTLFPSIEPDAPRDADGSIRTDVLSTQEWESFRGILGHKHVQANKIDPGPAMNWDYLIREVRRRLGAAEARPRDSISDESIGPGSHDVAASADASRERGKIRRPGPFAGRR